MPTLTSVGVTSGASGEGAGEAEGEDAGDGAGDVGAPLEGVRKASRRTGAERVESRV